MKFVLSGTEEEFYREYPDHYPDVIRVTSYEQFLYLFTLGLDEVEFIGFWRRQDRNFVNGVLRLIGGQTLPEPEDGYTGPYGVAGHIGYGIYQSPTSYLTVDVGDTTAGTTWTPRDSIRLTSSDNLWQRILCLYI